MTLQMIRADGVDWPLRTFLDVYGYLPVDRFIRPDLDGQLRVSILDDAVQLQPPRYADQVDWHGAVAWRLLEGQREAVACFLCGTSPSTDDICDPCWEDAEHEA